jgi:hypothetical protein
MAWLAIASRSVLAQSPQTSAASLASIRRHLSAPTTSPLTFTVNSTLDLTDTTHGNGQCNTIVIGKCTLRAAMEEANSQTSVSTTIILPAGIYTLTHGQLVLSIAIAGQNHSPVTIIGADARRTIIDGNASSRIFRTYVSQTLNLAHLMIRNGYESGGAGIFNEGTLNLNHVEVASNATIPANSGGGLYANGGQVSITNSSIHNNVSTSDGGGLYTQAGGSVFIVNSTFYENSAYGNGGAIRLGSSPPTNAWLYFDTIYGNQADYDTQGYDGGGIKNYGTANLVVKASLIEANCSGLCIGIFGTPDDCKGDLFSNDYNVIATITGCSISGSTANNRYAAVSVQTFTYNGGDTQSLSIPSYSYARDKVPALTDCFDQFGKRLTIDQRGYPRLGKCDIGAYEFALNIYLPLIRK